MRSFEILVRTGDRWLLGGAFDDAAAAVADAKSLVERSRVPIAVRVIAIEARASGFVEWVIHEGSTHPEPVATGQPDREPAPPVRSPGPPTAAESQGKPALPHALTGPRPRSRRKGRPKTARRPQRQPLLPGRYAAALFVVAVLGGIAVAAMRQPQGVWIFDTAEAQKPHALRNSWTGEIFH